MPSRNYALGENIEQVFNELSYVLFFNGNGIKSVDERVVLHIANHSMRRSIINSETFPMKIPKVFHAPQAIFNVWYIT